MASESRALSLEHELQTQNAELASIRQAVEISVDAIIAIDSEQRVTLFNIGAEEIFGYRAEEVIGKRLDMLLPERFRHAHETFVANFRDGDVASRRMDERREIYGRRRDGSEFPAEASISRMNRDGVTRLTVILRDITERKRFEHRLYEQNIALEKAIQAKDNFLANMSHELRTPLNSIIGFTGTMLMGLPGPLNHVQQEQLNIVQSSAKHLLAIINDLLDLAKIESGRVEVNLESVNCNDVAAEVVQSLEPQAAGKGLGVTLDVPSDPVLAKSDRRALGQILINLVNNAVKFTTQGEIRVRVSTVTTLDGSLVEITVADTGPGISKADQAQIFEAFERSTTPAARDTEGSGLGLHISNKLAGLIGAHIGVMSNLGEGSTFTVTLETVSTR